MDRIAGDATIDLGGGRQGFRGRDAVAGLKGTEVTPVWLIGVQEEMMAAIERSGQAGTALDNLQLLKAIRSGKFNAFVAGGTANALTIAMDPAPASWTALAWMPLRIWHPTPNTSSTVSLTPTELVDKLVVYGDGSPPQPGDLVGLMEYAYSPILDKFQILGISRKAALAIRRSQLVASRGSGSQLTASDVVTRVTSYNDVASYFDGGSTFVAGVLTIGAGDAGLWEIAGHCRQPFSGTSGQATSLHINNSATPACSDGGPAAAGGWSIVHASCSRILPLSAGTTVEMRVVQTTGGNVTFADLYSFTATRLGAA